jgi:hypothetical protein
VGTGRFDAHVAVVTWRLVLLLPIALIRPDVTLSLPAGPCATRA